MLQNDLITYRPKSSSTSVNISLLRNHTAAGTSSNSTGAGYRLNYSNIGSSSRSSVTSAVSKDRIITGSTSSVYRNSFLKRDHSNEDKSLYKYSNLKSNSRSRLNFGKSNCDDSVQGKSSEKSSLVDKYSYPERKSNERVSSVLNKYGNRITLGEKSREPEITTRYGLDTNRRSMLRENHENETKVEETKKEHTDHSVVSCKPLPTSETTPSRSSREPSPEINRTKASSCKVHSRISDYGRSATPTEIPTTLKFTNSSPLASSVNSATSQKTESSSGHFTSERLSSFDTKTIALNPDEKCNKTTTDEVNISELNLDVKTTEIEDKKNNKKIKDQENVKQITVTVVSRATSPSPPASSSFIRTRRADVARTIQKEITKVNKRIETKNVEVQSDRMDDTARYSRFASGTRMSPWPSYLDKFQTSGSYSRSYDSSSKTNNFGYNRRSDDRSSLSRHETTTTTATTISQSNKNIHSNLEPSDTLVSLTQNDIKTENVVDHRISPSEKENSLQKKENSISISSASSSSSPSLSLCRQFSSRSDGVTTPNESKSITRNSSMKSLKQQRQITRTSSSSSSAVTMPSGKSKSASAGSLTNQSIKIKTTPSPSSQQLHSKVASDGGTSSSISVNTKQCSSLNARGKPPVPKTSDCNSTMKTAPVTKYVNKDFRKSALNMSDAGDITRTKYHRKRTKSSQRSLSVSSQESESKDNELSSARTSSNTCKSSHIPRMSNNSPKSRSNNNLSISNLVNFQASRSNSESPPRRKNSACSTASASEKSSELSTSDSSTSENGDEMRLEKNRQRRRRRRKCSKISTSPRVERKREISLSSSRTSVFALSTDELSLMTDKSHQTYFNPHNSPSDKLTQSEEAKLMMIKTSTPSSLKSSDHEIKSNNRLNQSNCSISKKSGLSPNSSKKLVKNNSNSSMYKECEVPKRQFSGDRSWLADSNSDNPSKEMEQGYIYQDEISQETTVSVNLPDDGKYSAKLCRQDSGEQAWWLNQDDTSKREPLSSSVSKKKNSSKTSCVTNDHKNRLKHQQSGERAWWMSEDPSQVPEGIEVYSPTSLVSPIDLSHDNIDISKGFTEDETFVRRANRIRHIESGERAWWMDSNSNIPEGIENITQDRESSNSDDSSESFEQLDIHGISANASTLQPDKSISKFPIEYPRSPIEKYPLGDRISPEGIENSSSLRECYDVRILPYDNVHSTHHSESSKSTKSVSYKRPPTAIRYIGNMTNIDDLLGEITADYNNPMIYKSSRKHESRLETSDENSECEEIDVAKVIIHDSTPKTPVIQRRGRDKERPQPDGYIPLDDTALQLYKDGDYGAYLDLEASISEQQEEFEGFQTNRKNSIVLRTQLSVRVHTIIEKLLNSEGRELRRALFSLKQIFQEDKDLVHEFVQNDGLACLIKVGNEADQNYQNYILRALGQVMLYVDGMNGVIEHGQTVQWLYTLIASRFRLVVKTALKLLLVFVEYVETNSLLLVRAVRSVDTSRGMIPWTNVMKLLKDYDAADTELLIYATTLVNKCLNGIPDQDTYYDQVDCLEEQGIEGIIQRYMSKQGTDLDLLRQFQIYEAVLHHEDGNDRDSPIRQLDDNIRKTLRSRKSLVDSHERRKSRRHSTGTSPLSMSLNTRLSPRLNHSLGLNSLNGTFNSSLPDDDDESSSSQSSQGLGDVQLNGSYKENKDDVGVTPALRRRRERAERQRSFIREQQEATANIRATIGSIEGQEAPYSSNGVRYSNGSSYERNNDSPCNKISRANSRKDLTPLMNAANKLDSEEKKPWYGKSPDEGIECNEVNHTDEDEDRRVLVQMKREGTVKDLTQKLTSQNLIPSSPVEDKVSRIGDMSGLISKAKEGLAKSKSKADILKSPTNDNLPKLTEVKKSENELHWEELVNKMKRPLTLCDLDFTDLNSDDEVDVLGPVNVSNGVPPPPPPMALSPSNGIGRAPPPPPPGTKFPPPLPNGPSPHFGIHLKSARSPPTSESTNTVKSLSQTIPKKNKKTVKLFWKEVRDDPIILSRLDKNMMIWDELLPIPIDTQKLEHLFESRAKDLITKKQQEMNKNKEIIVLDHKRSNAINIGMTKLPPPRSIKTAILKMDATIMNREGIEKLLTMLPTEEERSRIQEAQAANPDLPLGSAEQFLLTLASISELPARLKLWAFKLDFENSEKEIADPLMDLKQGMETLRVNKTFRGILSTLLSVGIFLNGNEVKGFQLEYLTKVPEVKDTVHKHSLLHHLCHMVMEKFPDSTDLYSEIGAVTRASKIDFDELASNISKLESECKASWDHLKLIAKHDGSTMMKVKMSDFLADCAERIIVLTIVHRRIINRFHKFILWLGIPLHRVQDTKPNEFCRIISEFSLEYRTTRERVIQQLEKKANHRERNKTRGKMITEVGKFRTKEDRADAELRQLLGSDISDVESIHGTLPWRRQRKDGRSMLGPIIRDETTNGNVTDGEDELLESLVKTATKCPSTRTTPRERKRTRNADLRRTLKNGLSEEEKKHIAAYIKGY